MQAVTRSIRQNSSNILLCQKLNKHSSSTNKWNRKSQFFDFVKPRYLSLSAKSHKSYSNSYVEETYTIVVDRLIANSKKAKAPKDPKGSGSTKPSKDVKDVKDIKITLVKEGDQLKAKFSK